MLKMRNTFLIKLFFLILFARGSDNPPTLVFQGTIDDLAPVSRADTLVSRLKKAGVPVEYHRLKGWPHAMYVEVSVSRYC
jgi:acetyl esterase/lipase